jgi:periplasmic protein TonB
MTSKGTKAAPLSLMAHRSMSRPDPLDDSEPSHAVIPPESETLPKLSEIAHKLSAHGGGPVSTGLALDLVLNQIVEQACLLTKSSGAAIFLARGDEIVCRASAGTTAPELGVHLNRNSGLSGDCFQTKQWQRCDDAETDSRVDSEICRSLNIRSILVYPVIKLQAPDQEHSLGVIELFSPLPNAFADPAIGILQYLSQRIVENVDLAAIAAISAAAKSSEQSPEPVAPQTGLSFKETSSRARVAASHWTTALNAVVIALALLIGWMVGYAGWRRAGAIRHRNSDTVGQASRGERAPTVGAAPMPSVQSTAPSSVPEQPQPASTRHDVKPKPAIDTSGDGLVVYQDGKVVFRTPPTKTGKVIATNAAAPPVEISPAIANGYLVSRIEPDYPEQARAQHIQGPVVIDALVDQNGVVKELKTISGEPILVTSASDAVRQWRFKPFFRNGQPSEFQTRITVDFKLP